MLSMDEKSYLRKIVIYTRKEYLRKNRYIFVEDDIDSLDNNMLISIENVEINFEIKNDNEICVTEIERVFGDKNIMKIVEALTLREKLVLFSYYFENKTDLQIGLALNTKGDTARKIRVRALEKIRKQYKNLKGSNKDV